jgi:Na+-translocating ferredoxin:NAD+ oxidoreductase subunit B
MSLWFVDLLLPLLILVALSGAAGALLRLASQRLGAPSNQLTEAILRALPQTQCAQCNYPGCRPYAEAIASGEADINQCPPGGPATIAQLAELTGREPRPLDTSRGTHKAPQVALIDEARCIGCVLCIKACPVDAIIGTAKRMHTVIEPLCTGCELCIAPCPVDCITMIPAPPSYAPGVPIKLAVVLN